MNYKKSIILSVITLGLGFGATAQAPKFSLNGLGRSIINHDQLSGNLVDGNTDTQKSSISGYNLFDLQTNLGIDSTFKATAILRTRSPFGSSFGAITNFEFRQFTMSGKLKNLKYELGDIRVEMTPYTVFNNDVGGTGFESDLFAARKDILDYENFNFGNTWLLQGTSGQYAWDLGNNKGIGLYAFTTRTGSTNELTTPDRLLSGGRLEFSFNKNIKIGVNEVSMYDLAIATAEYDYTNHVLTGDITYTRKLGNNLFNLKLESGMSSYSYTDNGNDSTTSYEDGFFDLGINYVLNNPGLVIGLDVRQVGAVFASPTAQTRRINVTANPGLFSAVKGLDRGQILYDRFTSEDIYNSGVTPNLMAFIPYYNNINPYGNATPNRFVVGVNLVTDTSKHDYSAKLAIDYGTEVIGEGSTSKRGFMVISAGGVAHIGNLIDSKRLFDINIGFRMENTSRSGNAAVDLSSMLIDFGFAAEVLKKFDLLVGAKYFAASGNDFVGVRDGFNLVTGFNELNVDINELIASGGLRIRFSKQQSFSLNYNFVDFRNVADKSNNYNVGQLFFNYTGKF